MKTNFRFNPNCAAGVKLMRSHPCGFLFQQQGVGGEGEGEGRGRGEGDGEQWDGGEGGEGEP